MQAEPGVFGGHASPTLNVKRDETANPTFNIPSIPTTPTNPYYQSYIDVSTPTSIRTMSSSASHSPSLSHEIPTQLQPIPEVSQPQLYASIVETTRRDESTGDKVHVTGQIKMIYNGPSDCTSLLLLRLGNLDADAIVPDSTFVETWHDEPGLYVLKSQAFGESHRRTPVSCFRYQVDTSMERLPMQLLPAWRCNGDASYLIVKYKTNENFTTSNSQLAVCVKFDSVPVSHVQSTPQGTWDPTKQLLTWSTEALTASSSGRLLAKFITNEKGSPAPVILKYICKDSLASNVIMEAVPASGSTLQVKQIQTMVRSDNILFTSPSKTENI